MIDLKFGKYGIKTADKLNIVLYELVESKKEPGKHNEKVLGYYGELEQALNGYVKVAVSTESYTAQNVAEVIYLLKNIKEQIKQECARLENLHTNTIPVGNGENYEVVQNG